MTGSDLYARAHGMNNRGDAACHWCNSAAERIWLHDDPPVPMFTRSTSSAKNPSGIYCCVGCGLFRRKRVTVAFLTEGFRDGQTLAHYSWWLTDGRAVAVRDEDHLPLYKELLRPPLQFVLALKTPSCTRNELHLAIANDNCIVKADTPLWFTLDNVPHSYTIYELDSAIKNGGTGTAPGVQALLRFLGKPPVIDVKPAERGRPREHDGKITKRIVCASGVITTQV